MNKTIITVAALVIIAVAGFFVFKKNKSEPIKQADNKAEYNPTINPADFTTKIDNPYFSLLPTTKIMHQGKTKDGFEKSEFYVTNDKKTILGVDTIVVSDKVWLDGDLIEDTKDWFAQDKDGNVWYFGEDTAELEKGKILNHDGSWEAGVNNAKPGIIMQANPKVGISYREEFLAGEAEDQADVVSLTESVTVPFGSFTNCLKTKNYTALEPNLAEYKFYCKDAGTVALEIDADGERVELVSVEHNVQPTANETSTQKNNTTPPPPPPNIPTPQPPPTTISEDQAKTIALQRVPGTVTDVAIETKSGKQAYVVQIQPSDGGAETDVFVDMKTGEVIAVEQ